MNTHIQRESPSNYNHNRVLAMVHTQRIWRLERLQKEG